MEGLSGQRCPECAASLPANARFCPQCGHTLTEVRAEERKLVTVLFADITGSTALGERLDSERWRTILQRYFAEMAATIEAWGGTIQKFAGDAIMAVFGVPLVREDDAERALRAAFEMLDRLPQLNEGFEARHGISLAIRIGVNTGDVMAAPDQLIVTGDAVNVASRLEHAAEPGTILVGNRTYAATRASFAFGPAQERELRGKAAPVAVRQALHPLKESQERRFGPGAVMVGREPELAGLDVLLGQTVTTKTPRFALVYGPAGIGKSRLVHEFVDNTSAWAPDVRVLIGRCPSVGQSTYWAFGEVLRRVCEISLDDPVAVAAHRFRSTLREILEKGDAAPAEIDRTISALAVSAGIQLPNNPLDGLRPLALQQEIVIAWPRFASALVATGPVILLIEDLHWATDQALTLLERLTAGTAGSLLVVATARLEFANAHPDFARGRDDVTVVTLRPLTGAECMTLITGILEGGLPQSLVTQLAATADGNPFFLEEIVRRLIDVGTLTRVGDQWQVTGAADQVVLPDTVQAVLSARIDALPAAQKRVLQEAAVIGRVFWEEPVASAAGIENVREALLGLEQRGLLSIRPHSSIAGQVEFSFKHALIRDAAYSSLSHARQARAHAAAARWLEEMAGERAGQLSELIAQHYRLAVTGPEADLAWATDAVDWERVRGEAFEALLRAGAFARTRFAIDRALDLHDVALKLAIFDAERSRAFEQFGEDHDAAFHGDDAVAAWRSALAALSDRPSDQAARVRLALNCAKMTGIRWGGFKVIPPLAEVDAFVDEGLRGDPGPLDRAWLLAIRAYGASQKAITREGDQRSLEERVQAGEEGLKLGRELDDVDLQVTATRALSGLAVLAGDYPRAMEFTRIELGLVNQIVASRDRALAFFFLGLRVMDMEGKYEEALELGRRSYALAKTLSLHEVMHATYLLMYGLLMLGRWSEIDPLLDEHLDAWKKEADMSCPYVRGGPFFGAAALAWRGEVGRAREITATLPLDSDAPGLPEALAGLVKLACGDAAAARDEAQRALAAGVPPKYGEPPFDVLVMLDALVTLRDADGLRNFLPTARRAERALAILPPACDRAEGQLASLSDAPAQASERFERAIAAYEQLGASFEAARTKELLAGIRG